MEFISRRKDLLDYIRMHPQWYRKLSRNPYEVSALEIAALHFHERTIPHHVQKFSNGVQMASMMMGMLASMKQQD
ncbi:YlbE-like family protein [Bacillus massilinigeriensis]|uniref:YlbE-like family protein n=1 Tax=Bacillus mediterraneensis TaxID=1805474 RepID=UPI0031FDD60F